MEGCDDGRVLGAYGRDELNNNGKRLLPLASDNKLTLTNTFFSARRGGLSHTGTFDGINSRNDRKRIDYILTRQAHRPRVYDVKVHPQPPSPAKTDSDHNIVYAMVRLSGRIASNRRIRTKNQIHSVSGRIAPNRRIHYVQKNKTSLSTGRSFDLTEIADSE